MPPHENDRDPISHHWRVDRRIPLATVITLFGVILTMFIQTGGAFYWAATVNTTLDAFRQRLEAAERQGALMADQSAKLTAVEVKMSVVQDNIKELKELVKERAPTRSQR